MSADPALDRSLRALADAHRRDILSSIRDRPLPVGQIAQRLGLSQQTTSHHLAILRAGALVSESRQGTRHLFVVKPEGLELVSAFVERLYPEHDPEESAQNAFDPAGF